MAKTINLDDVEPPTHDEQKGTWSVWPDGWYRCLIDTTTYKPTKAGNGMCLHIKLTCVEQGEQFEQFLMEFLTLEHPNDLVTTIARSRMKEMALAAGLEGGAVTISDQLTCPELDGKTLMVRVYSKHTGSEYADRDGLEQKIGEYKSVAEYERAASGVSQKPATQADLLKPPPGQAVAPDDVPF
jgi:hypothetical protein